MTVRWKPLLILSGLFLVIAIVGVIAMVTTLVPKGAADILPMARAERKAKHFDKAKIYYQQALQKDSRNAATHEEFAAMYGEWGEQAAADQKEGLRLSQLGELIEATKYGKKLVKPRTQLLSDAMRYELSSDTVHWAKELVELVPEQADARYALAAEGLEERAPNLSEVKRHVLALQKLLAPAAEGDKAAATEARHPDQVKAGKLRVDWIKARLAELTGDRAALESILKDNRATSLPENASPVDRMALVRLRALDVTQALQADQTAPTDELGQRVEAFQAEIRRMVATPPLSPHRIVRLSLMLERVQKALSVRAAQAGEAQSRAAVGKLVDAIETDVESLFQKALDPASKPEISLFLTYADHLRYRQKRDQCLEAVARALKAPQATKPAYSDVVMALHAVAIEAALADLKDESRGEKAAVHIKELLASSNARYQGLGHLFQGAIDLERSGVAALAGQEATNQNVPKLQPKLRASALNHLKIAATQLPDVAEAQARYGVALVLSQEIGLGRQYLQNALRIGNLAAQYQIWAAWSMVQAGYPEEAQPIVNTLLGEIAAGRQSHEVEATLHLLNAEIHQARRTPQDLKMALREYERSVAAGQRTTAAIHLRLAQIEVQLGQSDKALVRIETLRKAGLDNPSVEHLAVLILQEQDKKDEARKVLQAARARYPKSEELVALDAALLTKEDKPQEADRVLVEFLKAEPESVGVAVLRAQVLAELLNKPAEARQILSEVAERSDNSSPLVQLALLDVKQGDFEGAKKTIAKIRARWKEAAASDLLNAQLALQEGNLSAAAECFNAALKKDPNNKLVQFWKAQIDGRTGSPREARETLLEITRAEPVKELDSGVTLMSAAESALASLELQSGDVDAAIQRFEELRKKNVKSDLSRGDRWQLAAAYNAKGLWPNAKKELDGLVNDPKAAPSDDERVRAASFYRQNEEEKAASAQLDAVLAKNPTHPGAVVVRAYMLSLERKASQASALLRKAIEAGQGKNPAPAVFYLMLAAVEDLIAPEETAPERSLVALDKGLEVQPDSLELVQAKYRLLVKSQGAPAGLAFAEAKAKDDEKGAFKRFLVQVHSSQRNYARAEAVLQDLLTERPNDSVLASNMLQVVALEAIAAADKNDRAQEKAINNKAAALIRDYRAKFPNELAFVQADCDLAARRGDLTRAVAITQEMDKLAKNAPTGPLNRARIYTAEGRTREAAAAFDEALERNPRQLDVRIRLGQARLKLGEVDEAIRQAKVVLDVNGNQPDALLLEAQALASQGDDDRQKDKSRGQAIELLNEALAKQPRFAAAYHEVALLQKQRGQRAESVATLKKNLKELPSDALGLTLAVEYLTEPHADGTPASDVELKQAAALASETGERDKKGMLALAVAIGYQKAGQLALALPWAEKAVEKSDTAAPHLNYGDLLLSLAEAARDAAAAKRYFEQAVAQYDLVLKVQANSVEATNNKAWILHAHLGQGKKALELVQGLLSRVDPAILPPEVFDTLGAILEEQGKARDAEEAYTKGLRKAPDHPVLNFHMGRLIAADKGRTGKAARYLEKANAGRDHLAPAMVEDLDKLTGKLGVTQAR